MQYRTDIDGLRAIAVLSVVGFHYFPGAAPGGFAGVDVFFVISGFLISGIVISEIDAGRFSFWTFYARRARRILPALLALCAVVLLVGASLFPPLEMADFALSVVAAIGFAANFHFKDRTGYFDAPAHDHPLLHTWSLAVEEQFYIIWPFALLALCAWIAPRWRSAAALLVVLAGLVVAEAMVRLDPNVAFFMLPARLWELALGALVFLSRDWAARTASDGLAKVTVALSAAALVGSLVLFDPSDHFPGLGAAPACLTTAAILLLGGRESCAGSAALSMRPMVWVGLLSYSLYLWHWPVMVFFGVVAGAHSAAQALGLFALALGLAWLSYRFVEQPARRVGARAPLKPQLALSAAAMCLVGGVAFAAHSSGGWPWRASETVVAVEKDALGTVFGCGGNGIRDGCPFGVERADGEIDVLLIGDSHAEHLLPYFDAIAKARGWSGRMFARGGCAPVLGVAARPIQYGGKCDFAFDSMFRAVEANAGARFVLVVARWDMYTEEDVHYGRPVKRKFHYQDEISASREPSNLRRVIKGGLERAIAYILKHTDAQIVLVQQTPSQIAPMRCVTLALFRGEDPRNCGIERERAFERLAFPRAMLREAQQISPRIQLLDPIEHLCDADICPVFRQGRILYSDEHHLTTFGAVSLLEAGLDVDIFGAEHSDAARRE